VAAPNRVARPPFAGRRVLLGVTGGIAAVKSVTLARELALAGAQVDTVLTSGALDFVKPLVFEALTGNPASVEAYATGDALRHIRLARSADLIVVAPTTADFLARAAAGMADDLLTAILLATSAPVLLCPAMNDQMFAHRVTQGNLRKLEEAGYTILGPADGLLAWGEGSGPGRMLEPETILDHIGRRLTGDTSLAGRRVVVTAGPTREPIDPVRFIGNRSSGRMGYAIAEAAWQMGADVVLISGPSSLTPPTGVRVRAVETAGQMLEAVIAELPDAAVLVMAAAVADFKPTDVASEKIKKENGPLEKVELEATADILLSTAA
jgi:phosphopantothenoylcysteine decarboxylase/phosphopantothenate--cysteine ligase